MLLKLDMIVDIIHVKYWHFAMYVLRIYIKVGSKNLYQKGPKDNLELFSALKIETGKIKL